MPRLTKVTSGVWSVHPSMKVRAATAPVSHVKSNGTSRELVCSGSYRSVYTSLSSVGARLDSLKRKAGEVSGSKSAKSGEPSTCST